METIGAAVKGNSNSKCIHPWKLVVFSIIPTLLLIGSGELAVRTWAHYFRTTYEQYDPEKGRLVLVPHVRWETGDGAEFAINAKGFVGPEFRSEKQDGSYRIFALGDSCTFGNGIWRRAYPAFLEGLVNEARERPAVEVINAGVEGYNSEYALKRLKEDVMQYGPNMIIVYVGWNDLMKVDPDHASATGRLAGLARLIDASYLMKAYKKVIYFYLRPLLFSPDVEPSEADGEAFREFVPRRFRENLAALIQTATDRGVTPVVVTLPTVVRRGMTQDEVEKRNVVFPYYAGAYSIDRFLSLLEAYNRTIREVAAQKGAVLVDLAETFNGREKRDLFWDTMHPSVEGHRLIARSMKEVVMRELASWRQVDKG